MSHCTIFPPTDQPKGQSADELFVVLDRLGKEGYGTVDHVQSNLTRESYAVRRIRPFV